MAEAQPMEAGVVNVLLTIDPAASHAAGRYLTWDGAPLDDEEAARCDAATPHELWAWALTAGRPGNDAAAGADVRRLTTLVTTASEAASAAFSEAVTASFARQPARAVLAGLDEAGRPYPVIFREEVLPRIFRVAVLPDLDGELRDEALGIVGRLEAAAQRGGAP